jgi:predicted ATPase/class 3 adenylate cyclase
MPDLPTLPTLPRLPTGTVTFLFTDIEGSTRLQQRVGPGYAAVRDQHHHTLRAAFLAHDGVEVDTQGDAFFVAFPTAPAALAAACDATRALAASAWPEGGVVRVRMGLHTGAPLLTPAGYVGLDVVRAARIASAGHGGQILLSAATRALVEDALPDGTTLRDLGAHRLKDLLRPEHLTQLVLSGLPADFPPLKTLDAHPHNLPIQPTPLLGREEQVAALCALLRREDVRLVTLTGPGGIGKTHLSTQVAAELVEDFADGVWFVRLSRLTDPTLVLATISQTLGLRECGGAPLAETLREYLRAKRLLLVLDNFEQVVDAAAEVGALLDASPGLRVLVTSRTPLRLRGEREYALAPLSLPLAPERLTPERLGQYAAVTLFIECSQAARADFAVTAANAPVIAEICARLDGLPLAIELAAARVKVLPPEALLARLSAQLSLLTGGARDADERQQTMRATIAWSADLLNPAERTLFQRLAVFVGGWTLEAAEAVCAAPERVAPLGHDVLDGLSALLDHSLVQQREEDGEARFTMLHVVREYALEQLEASGRLTRSDTPEQAGAEAAALRRAHAAYYLTLFQRSTADGPEGPRWLARLERDHDNLRAALRWARERGEGELGLRLAARAAFFWTFTGRLHEGAHWLEEMLALHDAHAAETVEAGDGSAERSHEALGARMVALGFLANYVGQTGDMARSEAMWHEVAAIAQATDDLAWFALTHNFLAMLALARGEVAQGLALVEETMALARQPGAEAALVVSMQNFVLPLLAAGASERAAVLAAESLDLARQQGSPLDESFGYTGLAQVATVRGDAAQALAYTREAARLERRQGITTSISNSAWDWLWALTPAWAQQGEYERAARLAGAFARETERRSYVLDPPRQALWNRGLAPARTALGEEAWAAAFAAGRTLPLEQAIAEALEESDQL